MLQLHGDILDIVDIVTKDFIPAAKDDNKVSAVAHEDGCMAGVCMACHMAACACMFLACMSRFLLVCIVWHPLARHSCTCNVDPACCPCWLPSRLHTASFTASCSTKAFMLCLLCSYSLLIITRSSLPGPCCQCGSVCSMCLPLHPAAQRRDGTAHGAGRRLPARHD